MLEKRKYYRLKYSFDAIFSIRGADQWYHGKGVNISVNGMMLKSFIHLLPMTRLSINFQLEGKCMKLNVIGLVVYVLKNVWNKKKREYFYGIKFTKIKKEEKKYLNSFISKMIKKIDYKQFY